MEEDAATVPVGLVVLAKGEQRFQCIRLEFRTLDDGRVLDLAVYRTKCKSCGDAMEVTGWARSVRSASFKKMCDPCKTVKS